MLHGLGHRWRAFRDDEEGGIAVEAALVFPMLTWAFLATIVYFDAFRSQATNAKAAYTVSDMISRETDYITPNYLDSLWNIHRFLTSSNYDTDLQVTIVEYDLDRDDYDVRWSKARGAFVEMTEEDLDNLRGQLPVMPDGEIVIVVQTRMVYEPSFSIGLDAFTFDNFIVTRPRFAPQLCYNSIENGDNTTATC